MPEEQLRKAALEYHRYPVPGKIAVTPTKALVNQRDLALAYTPGVAKVCEEIAAHPEEASNYTARGNLVAVITNGTAVLGLGNIGPLASKPVMEGKAVLFKKFAGIDVFDIEINELDPHKLVDIIAALEPTFGGINLEDIKAPECFIVERELRKRCKIPVFHDDQHGTAIIVSAAFTNGLKVVGKDISKIKLVVSGAGAAALACLDLLVSLGLKQENITVTDIVGVVYKGRTELMDEEKSRYAIDTKARKLSEVMAGADAFLGLSAGKVLQPEWVKLMAERPLIFALANPEPEILPELVKAVRPDAVMATGRSDYPNQVNNVLCFPFIFRGALDVGAMTINRDMEIAAVNAIAALAQAEQSEIVAAAYGVQDLKFGPDYLIPRPFDPRLIEHVAPAVAKAAMDSGVATRPITDFESYKSRLNRFVYQSGQIMSSVFAAAKKSPKRVVYAEGEEERFLRAAQQVADDGIARPILIGRPDVIQKRIELLGLRLVRDQHYNIIDPNNDPRYREYWTEYHRLTRRKGVSVELAKLDMRRRPTLIGAMMVHMGDADAMLCGIFGQYSRHLRTIDQVIGRRTGVNQYSAMNTLLLSQGTVFICDTYVTFDPTAEQIAESTVLAAEQIRRFGVTPKAAMLSHSSFGGGDSVTAQKMRRALELVMQLDPGLEVDGEMQGDMALSEEIRLRALPDNRLKGVANLLVMPNLDAANISFNLLKTAAGDGITIGPMLLGAAKPVHIITPSSTVRRIVNMTALSVVDAGAQSGEQKPLI